MLFSKQAALFSTCLLAVSSLAIVEGRSRMMSPQYSFPETRRGRATPPGANPLTVMSAANDPDQEIFREDEPAQEESFLDKMLDEEEMIMKAIQNLNKPFIDPPAVPKKSSHAVPSSKGAKAKSSNKLFSPRKVEDTMNQFGQNMFRTQNDDDQVIDSYPQLQGQFRETDAPVMNLQEIIARQEAANPTDPTTPPNDDVRCIPKVMQIEEIVYDRAIKCHHSYQEKCHLTYITDYQSTSEEKCETTFKKNCHITFKPMPFNETVSICNTPVERSCGTEAVGPDICSTQYETNCETRYNTYEIEQDEPVCVMELMKKCKNVTVTIPRAKRQAEVTTLAPEPITTNPGDEATTDAPIDDGGDGEETIDPTGEGEDGETITFDQKCEEWPVQKCTLEKKLVKKVHPDTACKKIPREVCVPNNCETVQGAEVCYDEVRIQVQNVPQEECDLQPEETCHMESVLVPRLVPQPNCVKVPKEICVNTKTNPRKVKKPIVKEWCYRPSDLAATGGA